MTPPLARPYRPFEVTGLELEYVVADEKLHPRCLVGEAFRRLHGRPTSHVELPPVGFSNELAAHVFELKTLAPLASPARIEKDLQAGVCRFNAILEPLGARLMPTGMHPFMSMDETRLWERANRAIYRAYDSLFGIRGHGWLNVQSCHVNLPFGNELEAMAQHNALALMMPYLPAISASSPVFEGRLGPDLDNRLAFYRDNQLRFPCITAEVVPRCLPDFAAYRREVFGPIAAALRPFPEGALLDPEWVNSRGAILRFARRAIELRVLDTQECVRMDVAMAVFVRGALRWLTDCWERGELAAPDQSMLVEDFNRVVHAGRGAEVTAGHLRPLLRLNHRRLTAGMVMQALLEQAAGALPARERPYLELVSQVLRKGSLAERIRKAVGRPAADGTIAMDRLQAIYGELADCLQANASWRLS